MLICNYACMDSNYYYMYVLWCDEVFGRIYNKILDRDWFSTPVFVKESVRDHVVIIIIIIIVIVIVIVIVIIIIIIIIIINKQ